MTERAAFLMRVLLAMLATALCADAFAGTITLRPGATIESSREVTLGDIADLEGEDAKALAGIRVGFVEGASEVTIAQVRAALDTREVNWGRIALRGSSCAVRIAAPAIVDASVPTNAPTERVAPGLETVRDRILATLGELFGAEPDAIRVTLDDAGKDILSRPVHGRRVDIETSSASSSRIAIRVWMYEGDRLIVDGSVRADVSLRIDCLTLSRALGKGDRLDASMFSRTTLWMAPTGAPPVRNEAQAIGAVARTRLDAGTVLRTDHIEAPIVIKRGDLVSVHALAGSMVLKTQARALADAREGEMVELSRGRDRKAFLARAAGPGLAILDTSNSGGDSR
jgi:flagella basal body P-ring formation protein FlgA